MSCLLPPIYHDAKTSGHTRGPGALFLAFLCASLLMLLGERAAQAADAKVFRSARLTHLAGDVRVEQAGNSASSEAVVNLPVVEGAVISTGADGEAELEFEDGSLLRLTPRSGAALVNLSIDSSGEYHSRVSILGGLAYVELRAGTRFHYIVDAGGDEITPIENAVVRINFDEAPAIISILDGSAHLTAASGADVAVSAGQTARSGDASEGGAYVVREVIAPESWDQWNLDRDAAAANEAATETDVRSKYAGDQGYGWADLDANGNWYDVPGQGEVWQPNAAVPPAEDAAGDNSAAPFDPYGYGSWAYTPAGYVWASSYGWGWLPYHCGTWNYWDGFGWAWSPNYACGVFGFGGYFDGGVYIGRVPDHYKKPGRPLPRPGPIHPILHGRGGPVPVAPLNPVSRTDTPVRVIAGNTVTPLPRAGGVVTATGFSGNSRAFVGAGLQRDYPIDRTTHVAVMGMQSSTATQPPSSNARAAWHPIQPGAAQRPGYSGYARPAGDRPAPVIRQAPSSQPRPSAPTPPSAPASHPAAASSGHGR
jgi:hypothetical protein